MTSVNDSLDPETKGSTRNTRWEAVVYLLPGRPDDRTEIVQEFADPQEALAWASSAVVHAYAESPDDHTRATFYPAHRMSHSVVRRKD